MATPADFAGQAAAALEALLAPVARLASDYRVDLEPIPAEATRYQLRIGPTGKDFDSNATRTVLRVEVAIHRRIVAEAERDWTEDELQTHLEALVAPAWWRGLAAVYEVTEAPSYELEVVGRVVTATVSLELSLTP